MQSFTVHQQPCEACRPASQWPTFIMLQGCLHGPFKMLLLVTNMSGLIECWSLTWWNKLMQFFPPRLYSLKGVSVYLFSNKKIVHVHSLFLWLVCRCSQSRAFIGSPFFLLLCRRCHFEMFWVGAPYTVLNLPRRRPRDVRLCCGLRPSIIFGHCQRGKERNGINILWMKWRAWWDYIQLSWECKSKWKNRAFYSVCRLWHI